jgi:hypothetical protein
MTRNSPARLNNRPIWSDKAHLVDSQERAVDSNRRIGAELCSLSRFFGNLTNNTVKTPKTKVKNAITTVEVAEISSLLQSMSLHAAFIAKRIGGGVSLY